MQAAVQAASEKARAEALAEAAKDGKFSQADLDRIAGESRKAGREVAEKELLKSLGVDNVDAAKAAMEAARVAEDEKKTALEKSQEDAAKARAEADQARAEAKSARIHTALELKLRDAGINPERAAAAMRLVDQSALEVNGSEVTGLDVAVEGLKTVSPEWFGAKPFSPPNASGEGGKGPVDYKTASVDDRDKALGKYGVKL